MASKCELLTPHELQNDRLRGLLNSAHPLGVTREAGVAWFLSAPATLTFLRHEGGRLFGSG
jgi:hypothetical protein